MPRFAFGLVPGAFLAASLLATPERSSGAEPPDGGPVKIVIQILTDLNIASLTIDVETFGPWAKPILEKIERRFRHEPGRRDVVLQVTLHREGPPEVAAGGRPALSDDELKALVEAADAPAAPHARLADFAFRLVAKINGGIPTTPRRSSPGSRHPKRPDSRDSERRPPPIGSRSCDGGRWRRRSRSWPDSPRGPTRSTKGSATSARPWAPSMPPARSTSPP